MVFGRWKMPVRVLGFRTVSSGGGSGVVCPVFGGVVSTGIV